MVRKQTLVITAKNDKIAVAIKELSSLGNEIEIVLIS